MARYDTRQAVTSRIWKGTIAGVWRPVPVVALLILLALLLALPGCNPAASPTNTPEPPPPTAAVPSPTPLPPTATPKPAPTATPAPTAVPTPTIVEYTVEAGDNLHTIAAQFGVTGEEILKANNIENPDLLLIGQKLKIPKKQ